MFKRLFWLLVGVGFGFGSSFWVMRAARRTAQRYSPPHVAGELTVAARGFADDLRAAIAEGRAAVEVPVVPAAAAPPAPPTPRMLPR